MPFGHHRVGAGAGSSSLARFSGPANKVPTQLPAIRQDVSRPYTPYSHATVTGIADPAGTRRGTHGHAPRFGTAMTHNRPHGLSRPRSKVQGIARVSRNIPGSPLLDREPSSKLLSPRATALPPLGEKRAASTPQHSGAESVEEKNTKTKEVPRYMRDTQGSSQKAKPVRHYSRVQDSSYAHYVNQRRTQTQTLHRRSSSSRRSSVVYRAPTCDASTASGRHKMIRLEGKVLREQRLLLEDLVARGELDMQILDVSRLGDLWAQFTRISRLNKRDGFIDRVEFNYILEPFGLNDSPFGERLFSVWDSDGNGVLDVREFLLGMASFMEGSIDQKVGFAFRVFDLDDSGYLTMDEIYHAFWSSLSPDELERLESSIRAMFDQLDQNDDGQVSLSEFKDFAKRDPTLVQILFPNLRV